MTVGSRWIRRVLSSAIAVGTGIGFAVMVAAPAAQASTPGGTILYDKGGNIFQTTADKATTWQVTHDGTTPTTDKTGSTGYTVPTESSSGLIVAVRNQDYGGYTQGFLWVMDRNGKVIRKFKPPQFNPLAQIFNCPGPLAQFPGGINTATISPDGKHVAYTALATGEASDCSGFHEFGAWVVNIDGTNGHALSAGADSLETGGWVSNSRLLVDDPYDPATAYYVDLPGLTTTKWVAAADLSFDQAYEQPVLANGVMATDGYSQVSGALVIRLWAAASFDNEPAWQCEYPSVAHPNDTNDNLNEPSLSPDASEVVFEDYEGDASGANDGIYLAPAASTVASSTACTNATQALFVQGAEDPFWTTAAITQLPADTTAPTVSLTAPTAVAVAASSVRIAWSGHDDYSGVAHYQLRYRKAAYSGTYGAWSYPSSWQALTGTSLTQTGLAPGYDYCWSVRAIDHAGNASAWTGTRCTAVALDDRALAATSAWTRGTGSGYYDHTITRTTRVNAVLTRTHAQTDRVGIVATRCSTCGEVALYVGSARVGIVNLHASSTHYHVLTLLHTFSLRSVTVTVKVLTSGKLVAVDGVVISRS